MQGSNSLELDRMSGRGLHPDGAPGGLHGPSVFSDNEVYPVGHHSPNSRQFGGGFRSNGRPNSFEDTAYLGPNNNNLFGDYDGEAPPGEHGPYFPNFFSGGVKVDCEGEWHLYCSFHSKCNKEFMT